MIGVLMVVTTTLCFAASTESCTAGVDRDCEDGPLSTWEERVESCLMKGRPVPFLYERSQFPENVFKQATLDRRFLPSELQESPQRVGDDLCPTQPQLSSVLQIYCDGSLQYETARGSSQTCAVKMRKENRTNTHCSYQVESRKPWKCESTKAFSCVPCRSPNALNIGIIPSIKLNWLNPTEQGSSHPQYPKHPREETTTMVTGMRKSHVEVINGDLLINKSVFCYFLDPPKESDLDVYSPVLLHTKKSTDIKIINGEIVWCEGVDIWTGQVIRSQICLKHDHDCNTSLGDRKVSKALETLGNKSRSITNVTEAQNAMDLILRSARTVPSRSMARALEGFENFVSTVTLGGRRELRIDNSSLFSTLVAASAAGVTASASAMKSLPRGSDAVAIAGRADLSVAVVLPPEAGNRRVALTKFMGKAMRVFQQSGHTANSDVVSVTVEGDGVDYVDVVLRRRRKDKFGKCAIWNLDTNRWDTSYCEMLIIGEVGDVCRCWHLTHFGEIIVDADVDWGESRVLDAISMLGCSLSLLGVSGVAATAAISDEWRRRPSTKVLLQLVGAVALRDATFVAVAVHDFPDTWCRVAGVALHYAVLAAACWSVAAAVLQTLRLGTIAGIASVPHVVMVCALGSWLLPLLPVGLVLAVEGPGAYAKRGDATGFCFPRGLWFYASVAIPAGLAVLVNSGVFCYLMYVIFQCSPEGRRIRKSSNGSTLLRRKLLTCALLFFLFGLTWVFGFPARSFVMACIFCALASPQGFVLFLFFVFGDAKARKKWSSALSTNDGSSRTSKKSFSNRTFKKQSSSGTHNVTPLLKGDETAVALQPPEGNAEEITYRFSGSPPRGAEVEIAQAEDYDLPQTSEVDGGSGMYNFPSIRRDNQPTVVLKSYVTVKEENDEEKTYYFREGARNRVVESEHYDRETDLRAALEGYPNNPGIIYPPMKK